MLQMSCGFIVLVIDCHSNKYNTHNQHKTAMCAWHTGVHAGFRGLYLCAYIVHTVSKCKLD